MLEKLKRIGLLCIGYIALFTAITFIFQLIRRQPLRFDVYFDLIAAIGCAIGTGLTEKRRTGHTVRGKQKARKKQLGINP